MRCEQRNVPVCTRAQHLGNVYGTCTYQRGRINSTVPHRHPYEIHTLRRLSDVFCHRKRICARNKRSPSRFRSVNHPPLSFLISLTLSFFLILIPARGWVCSVIITSVESTTTTPRRTYSRAIHPFRRCAHAPCWSNYFVFHRATVGKNDEDRKVAAKVRVKNSEGFSRAILMTSWNLFQPRREQL